MEVNYETLFAAARRAGAALGQADPESLSRAVERAARLLREGKAKLLEANARDLAAMAADGTFLSRYDLPQPSPGPYEEGREYRYGKTKLTVCRRSGSVRP